MPQQVGSTLSTAKFHAMTLSNSQQSSNFCQFCELFSQTIDTSVAVQCLWEMYEIPVNTAIFEVVVEKTRPDKKIAPKS